jgi:hypothetical protein
VTTWRRRRRRRFSIRPSSVRRSRC